MATVSLDQLREDVSKKFQEYTVDLGDDVQVTLRPALRLPKGDRAKLRSLQRRYSALGDEQDVKEQALKDGKSEGDFRSDEELEQEMIACLHEQIKVLASNKSTANKLLGQIGDDLAMLMHIVREYIETTQPGEASASQS